MMKTKSNHRLLIPLFCVLITLAGCLRKTEEVQKSTTNPPVIGVVDESSFSLKLCLGDPKEAAGFASESGGTCEPTNYHIHKSGSSTAACEVSDLSDSASWSTRNIDCVAEVYEQEFWFWGAKLNINVPSSACEYFRFRPYWYWGLEPGRGPTQVQITRDATGSITSANFVPASSGYVDGGAYYCYYDYSRFDGPNCCIGEGGVTENNNGTVTTSKVSWGGKLGNCANGAGMGSGEKDSQGLPISTDLNVLSTGLNTVYHVQATSKSQGGVLRSIHGANYVNSDDHTGGLARGLSSFAGRAPSRFYEFECLDRASEVKARIRLQIRDWNRVSDLEDYVAGNTLEVDADANSNTGGSETKIDSSNIYDPGTIDVAANTITVVPGPVIFEDEWLQIRRTWLENGDPVVLMIDNPGAGRSMPGGLQEFTQYYVLSMTVTSPSSPANDTSTETFQLSATPGGPPVDITSAGASGTIVKIFSNDEPDLNSPRNDYEDWRDFGQFFPGVYSSGGN